MRNVLSLLCVVWMYPCYVVAEVADEFHGNRLVLLQKVANPEAQLWVHENAVRQLDFLEDGLEFKPFAFSRQHDKKDKYGRAERFTALVGLKSNLALKLGESLGVLLHFRYPKVTPDRIRWVKFRVGPYEISIHRAISFHDIRNPDKRFAQYLTPFATLACKGDRDIWLFVSHEREGLRFSMIDKENPEYTMTCFWKLEDLSLEPEAYFGMNRQHIIEREHHTGPSHLFKAAWMGPVSQEALPKIIEIPENKAINYMTKRLVIKRGDKKAKKYLKKIRFAGSIQDEEIEALHDYFLNIKPPNYDHHFSNFTIAGIARWLYEKTEDVAILNKLLVVCESVYRARNDIDPNLKIKFYDGIDLKSSYVTDIAPPCWPKYNVLWYDDQNELGTSKGVASFSGINWSATTARLIAENEDLWNRPYNGEIQSLKGKNYREIAMVLLGRSGDILDFFRRFYLEHPNRDVVIKPFVPKDMKLYVTSGISEEKIGIVPYFNRLFPLLLGQLQVMKALRAFGERLEYANELEDILEDHIAHFISYIEVYERKGMEVLKYPYSASDWPRSDKMMVEDRAHGSFDNRVLMHFYEEGYFPQKYVELYANTLLAMHVGDGKFEAHIDGKIGKPYEKIYGGGEGYFYLARFNSKLIECLWKTHYNNNPLQAYGILRSREAWGDSAPK